MTVVGSRAAALKSGLILGRQVKERVPGALLSASDCVHRSVRGTPCFLDRLVHDGLGEAGLLDRCPDRDEVLPQTGASRLGGIGLELLVLLRAHDDGDLRATRSGE